MINTEYYTNYFSEPGVEYFIDNESTFVMWEGYFYELFIHITAHFDYQHYPIEFKDYNDLAGWKDDIQTSRKIDSKDTKQKLEFLLINKYENREDYSACYLALMSFFNANGDKDIFIREYL